MKLRAGGVRRRDQGRRLRPGLGPDRQSAHQARAARPSSWRPSMRGARRWRCSRAPPSTCSTGSCPAPSPTTTAGFDLRPVLSSLAEVRDWAAYSRSRGPQALGRRASRHRHEPARHAGIRNQTARRRAGAARGLRYVPGDEPPRLRREPDNPMNERQRQSASMCCAPSWAARGGEPGQFRRHLPGSRLPLRSWCGPGIALYGGRAHEGGPNPMQTVVRFRRQDPAGP